jgi:MoaA/NifB/PqqE/SkfB family radical SAM enzyme
MTSCFTPSHPDASPVSGAFASYCTALGIAPAHAGAVARILDDIKNATLRTVLRPSATGAAPPFVRYVHARHAAHTAEAEQTALGELYHALQHEQPAGAERTYLAEAQLMARERLSALGEPIGDAALDALESQVLQDPFGPPTGYDAFVVLVSLYARGLSASPTPALRAVAAELGLDDTGLGFLLGALEALLAPHEDTARGPRRGASATAIVDTGAVLGPLSVALPAAAFAALEPGLRACADGTPLDSFPMGRALRAQLEALIAREGARLGRHAHRPEQVAGRFCPSPFEYAQVNADGKVYGCCPAMLPAPLGDLRYMGIREAWNSPMAVKIRESVLDGSYRYCDGARCGFIKDGTLARVETLADPRHARIVRDSVTTFPEGPRTINMAYDRTCNLGCPSCRPAKIALKGNGFRAAERIQENLLDAGLQGADRLIITGSGDPFASKLFLGFLRTFRPATRPGLRIQLSTNGVLLTPDMWASICHEAVDMIDVSIDAATPETYALNRGGNFARLVENLHFMGGLLREGAIHRFAIHMVVQSNNYREMPAFAALGRAVGASHVYFKELQDWGTFPAGDFARRAVQSPAHPEHAAFLAVLNDPSLRAPGTYLFDMGDLLTLHALG